MGEKRKSSCGGCGGLIVLIIIAGAVVSVISKNGAPPSQPVASTPAPASAPPTPPSTTEQATPAPAPVTQQPATANTTNQNTPAPTPPTPPEDWTTTDGKTYKNVTVISHDANNVTINSSDGAATFPISHLDKDLQKRIVDDNVTASDWTVNGETYHNVKVGAVESDAVHITFDEGVGSVALADLPPDLQKKFNYDPNRAPPTQKEANAIVGLTKQESIRRFGQPIRDEKHDSPDGPFEQLVFNDSKGTETFFMLFEKDGTYDGVFYPGGTVSSGSYRGLSFPAKTPDEIVADKAKPADSKKEANDFIQTLASMGVDNTIVKSVSVEGDRLTIVVTDNFHIAPYQTRLQVAQNFEKLWAAIHPPANGNISVPLSITDYNGNEVGGTGLFGVWVQKEQ